MRHKLILIFIIIVVLFAVVGFSWKSAISNNTNTAGEEFIIIDNESPVEIETDCTYVPK